MCLTFLTLPIGIAIEILMIYYNPKKSWYDSPKEKITLLENVEEELLLDLENFHKYRNMNQAALALIIISLVLILLAFLVYIVYSCKKKHKTDLINALIIITLIINIIIFILSIIILVKSAKIKNDAEEIDLVDNIKKGITKVLCLSLAKIVLCSFQLYCYRCEDTSCLDSCCSSNYYSQSKKTPVQKTTNTNAIETNKIVKFNLKDVRVNAFNPLFNLAYIEDESGISELNLKKTNISIKGGDILNGYIIGTKEVKDLDYMGNYPDMKEHVLNPGDYTSALTFSATEGTIEPVVATIAEAAKEGNHGRIMQISNFEVQTSGRFTYAVQGDDKIQLADDFMLYDFDYVWPTNIESIVGLVTYNGVRWQISPISVESVVTGIQAISSNRSQSENMVIYNLQGVCMNSLQKGINIVNGRKVVIK